MNPAQAQFLANIGESLFHLFTVEYMRCDAGEHVSDETMDGIMSYIETCAGMALESEHNRKVFELETGKETVAALVSYLMDEVPDVVPVGIAQYLEGLRAKENNEDAS